MMTDTLPLSDLLTRRLYLQWYEGVAIVRGVARQLLEQQGSDIGIPDLQQIELLADGSVALAGGVHGSEPVRRLGQLLQAVLTDASVPVQLRLIVSQATAPMPSYSSVAEFDLALGFFERPDRAELLTALFARAIAAGPAKASDAALTLDRLAPLPEAKPADPVARSRRQGARRLIGVVVIVIAALVLSSAAVLYLRQTGTIGNGRTVSRTTTAAADAVGAAVLAGVSAVSDSMGLGRIVAADAADPVSAPASPSAGPPVQKERQAAVRAEPVSGESVPLHTVVAYEVPEDTIVTGALDQETDLLESSGNTAVDAAVYAVGADGVSPPVGLGRQLRQLPATVDPAELVRIEVVIAPDGSVEMARLLSPRRHVLGGMLLSAAKTWQFRPAMKDGIAVRYRKTILVSFE